MAAYVAGIIASITLIFLFENSDCVVGAQGCRKIGQHTEQIAATNANQDVNRLRQPNVILFATNGGGIGGISTHFCRFPVLHAPKTGNGPWPWNLRDEVRPVLLKE